MSTPASVTFMPTGKSYRWNREHYSKTRRFFDIWFFVWRFLGGRWLLGKAWSYWGG
nr:hypothetical protein [Thermostichus lividus]